MEFWIHDLFTPLNDEEARVYRYTWWIFKDVISKKFTYLTTRHY